MTLTEDIDDLRRVLRYDPITGKLWWTDLAHYIVKGKEAASTDKNKYIRLKYKGKPHKAHRIAWALFYGKFPNGHIDHINGDPTDNRICNLRDVTRFINLQNQRHARSDSTTGVLGITKNGPKWRAEIRVNGKKKNLGTYATQEQAHEAYVLAKRQHHEGCTI